MSLPTGSIRYGFVDKGLGAHVARTIMVAELENLFGACPTNARVADYRQAITRDNALLKRTTGARLESYRRLRQLYGLTPSIPVFGVLRELWDRSLSGHPLLALLCGLARDPVLRSTLGTILEAPEGYVLTAGDFATAIEEQFPQRLNTKTLASAGRNVASSWTQSGHLSGDSRKIRRHVEIEPVVVVYALLLAHLSGGSGDALFQSNWLTILDAPTHILRSFAEQASRQGWLEYRHSGQVTVVSFRHFLGEKTA